MATCLCVEVNVDDDDDDDDVSFFMSCTNPLRDPALRYPNLQNSNRIRVPGKLELKEVRTLRLVLQRESVCAGGGCTYE